MTLTPRYIPGEALTDRQGNGWAPDTTLVDGRPSAWVGAGYDDITGWMATLFLGTIAAVYWFRSRPKSRV